MDTDEHRFQANLTGVLLGTAVGDALGLPAENLSRERIKRLWHGQWQMRFLFSRGMVSDDTEHTLMVAQALLAHPQDAIAFQRCLAWKFRWWFIALPAGVGLATAKACLKLWIGFPPEKSAVTSAGNGPAMRSAIIGCYFAGDPTRRREFILASTRLTHRSWQAEVAALAIAEAVACAVSSDGSPQPSRIVQILRELSSESEWLGIMSRMESSLAAQNTVPEFADSLGLRKRITGYALHTVPVALYAWLRHPGDFRTTLVSALECGGDTDTVGAIVGGLSGATTGKQGIPSEWLNTIWEWPRTDSVMEKIAAHLANQKLSSKSDGPINYFWPAIVPRNLLFLVVVFVHGFRRLFPPYGNLRT